MHDNTDHSHIKKIIVYFAIALIVAATAVTLGILSAQLNERKNQLEALYQRSYYDVVEVLNNIEESLAKLEVSTDASSQSRLLNSVWSDSQVAESELSVLMDASPEQSEVLSFVNKLGDYAFSLSLSAEGVSYDDRATLSALYSVVVSLKTGLENVKDELLDGSRLTGALGKGLNYVTDSLNAVNFSTLEIPELIYDGPFSDALNDKELKFLADKPDLSADETLAKVKEVFPDATFSGEQDGDIPSYIFSVNKDEGVVYATKKGGYIYQYNYYKFSEETNLSDEEYIGSAKDFLSRLGYEDMQEVWISNNNSTVYVNFAYTSDDIVIYPDLMVVKLSGDTGEVLGLDGQNYIYNHTPRTIDTPQPESSAREALSPDVTVKKSRLTLIPTDWNTEILAYEYECSYGEYTYYIYVDACTLKEVRILRVIDDEGTLLA